MAPFDSSVHTQIAIIGAGFGGIGTAIRLKKRGIDDFVVLERADDVGGTWRDNTYPGCASDVESHLYSFSFALNPDWTHHFPPQPEIWDYLRRCAADYGVLPHVRFAHEVLGAIWDDHAECWRIETTHGAFTAAVIVMANGPLSEPVVPPLPGLERFEGRAFHSAQWDHGYDLSGRQVAVIGTGASAIQFVPEIQPKVGRLFVFQRTPAWVIPRPDRVLSERTRRLFRRVPLAQRALRLWIYLRHEARVVLLRHPWLMRRVQRLVVERYLEGSVPDPALRAKLTPNYTMGCKRVVLSNDYFPAVARPNVEVVTSGIAEVRARSIVGGDGVERPVDAIIFGTGFQPTDPPLARHIRGRDGRTLAEVWGGSPKAYLGTSVAGFPNFFMLLGPNTGLGHNSVIYMMEAQIAHVVSAVRYMRRYGLSTMEPRVDAQAKFVARVDRRMRGTVWVAGGCRSWYLDATGRNSTLWPDFTWRYRRRVARLKPGEYVVSQPRPQSHPVPTAASV